MLQWRPIMRHRLLMATAVVSCSIGAAPSRGDTWCSTTWPNAVFCDDFDRYCVNPPPAPQQCTSGATYDGAAFGAVWKATGDGGFCGSPLSLDNGFYSSPPYAGKMNTQQGGEFGYSVNLAVDDGIRNAFGTQFNSIIGTDANPLVLEWVQNGQSTDKGKYNSSFMSIVYGSDYAPTDWAYSEFCACESFKPRFPIICQQETAVPGCPPLATAPNHAALAAGFNVYLDTNPCHCGESISGYPYNVHLSFFDGRKWYRLRQGLFPGSGDFLLRPNENKMKLTITSTKVKVELTTPSTGEYSWCEVAGAYTGPFSTIATGFHKACRLNSNTWTCATDPTCEFTIGIPPGGVTRYDNIALAGGVGYVTPGACCYPDTHCTDALLPSDCQNGGGSFAGPGTTCAQTACCPPQPGDHDLDGDVDVTDFSDLQLCLSGTDIPLVGIPCRCWDFNNDGDVDGTDVTTFLNCMKGPGMQADPGCAN